MLVNGPAVGGIGDGRWVTAEDKDQIISLVGIEQLPIPTFGLKEINATVNLLTSHYYRETLTIDNQDFTVFRCVDISRTECIRALVRGYRGTANT
jgi:hypothetical protein